MAHRLALLGRGRCRGTTSSIRYEPEIPTEEKDSRLTPDLPIVDPMNTRNQRLELEQPTPTLTESPILGLPLEDPIDQRRTRRTLGTQERCQQEVFQPFPPPQRLRGSKSTRSR